MTVTIGITGPIGCGKSSVAGWLRELGAVTVDADAVARAVVEPGEPALDAVLAAFGPGVRGPDGTLDRAALGWIGVALAGSNPSTTAMFGPVQAVAGRLLHMPPLLLPSLGSVGAEVGKPVAPQTASVGVSTTSLVRSEGQVIRHNMGWTLIVLAYLMLLGILFYAGPLRTLLPG